MTEKMYAISQRTKQIIESAIIYPLCGVLKNKVVRGSGCCVVCAKTHRNELRRR
jgi:hypothetical protein